MKTQSIIFSLGFLLLLSFAPEAEAQTFSERESVSKVFALTPETQVEINNKYGKVHLITWQKDSIKFVADLNISSNNLARLKKIRNSINFDFTNSKYYITANTDFGSTSNQIFTELRNLSEAFIPGKNSIEVNYTVYCPENINLSIINKFGDVYIDDIRGEIKISLSNGDLKINSISGDAQISLDFGNGIINHISKANLSVSYSDINIKAAENLQVSSKSSTIHINDIDIMNIDSRRDKYFIGKIRDIRGEGNFSTIWIENLRCRANMNMKFGDFNIDKINNDFCDIILTSEFSDLSLYISKQAKYEADIYYPAEATVNLPEHETVDRSESERHSFFTKGEGKNLPDIKITALQKCYINLIEK